jgi:CheY-like chemotaxis protein
MYALLVVDDNSAVRYCIGNVLRDARYKVTEAASGSRALQLLERTPFDLMIVDYLLPDLKGDAIARIAANRWPSMRIAFLSAYAEFLSLTGKAGDNLLISKPISSEELCKAVASALKRPCASSTYGNSQRCSRSVSEPS